MGIISCMFRHLLLLLSCFHIIGLTNLLAYGQPLCLVDERSALLQLKRSFSVSRYASVDPFAYPKVDSWRLEGNSSDCCSWDGVECDEDSGHVIGLHLSSSLLYGSINSNSSLFRLVHLQRLNLADNHFNYSQIPSEIGQLSRLTSLNLSQSTFSGQIPPEISDLFNLISLDLSYNIPPSSFESLLKLQNPGMSSLVQNLTNLRLLDLSKVDIFSEVPNILANLSSLTYLSLKDCRLYGEFPSDLFNLPKIRTLSMEYNQNLTGYLPTFNQNNTLEYLRLSWTSFFGKLPDSIGNVKSLKQLDLGWCNFTGSVPTSVGNLVQLKTLEIASNHFTGLIPASLINLTQLTALSLSNNSFSGSTISWIGKQTKLIYLGLYANNLYGEIPSSMGNLTRLSYVLCFDNQLTGEIPPWLVNLTQLTVLELGQNKLYGPIPLSIFELTNLVNLNLEYNYLSGTVDGNMFLKLNHLNELHLSGNILSLTFHSSINATIPKFKLLGLSSCKLNEFPEFLQYQDETLFLDLSKNNIRGHIPNWIWKVGPKTLVFMDLASNLLTRFEEFLAVLPWERLHRLHLHHNILRGPLPIPPASTVIYEVSNNLLSGEIPTSICNRRSLRFLDLSNNNLSGTIPQCLSISESLAIMNLQSNNFEGPIPPTYNQGCNLRAIDLSQNQLDGIIPRSLANCTMLENLNLGNNQINDTFPFWLGTLPQLKILLLSSNQFHGTIAGHQSNFDFPSLQIIDLSYNAFSGELPSKYFQNWNASKIYDVGPSIYFQASTSFQTPGYYFSENFTFSMTIKSKGLETFYKQILTVFAAIDLSSNKFDGEIPESIGSVKGLQLLNLSSNCLVGSIPPSLGSLTELQALDLSQNELSGEIPQQLIQLTFLAFLNVSHNHLTGTIPRGNQFSTFDNSSFDGNPGLCGDHLSTKCGSSEALPPPTLIFEAENLYFTSKSDWIFIYIGYGSGIVVGWVIGDILQQVWRLWPIGRHCTATGVLQKKKQALLGCSGHRSSAVFVDRSKRASFGRSVVRSTETFAVGRS